MMNSSSDIAPPHPASGDGVSPDAPLVTRQTQPVSSQLGRQTIAHTEIDIAPGDFIKQYEVIREIGQGGMGRVFLARDTRLARLCAIKILLLSAGLDAEHLLHEARATARCVHENIVVVYEVDAFRGYPYIVLEYLKGQTLRARIRERCAPFPEHLATEIIVPVVRALHCAHELGIVHRDLKPENILLTDLGQVKVLDFGIAKQFDLVEPNETEDAPSAPTLGSTSQTTTKFLVGTLPYMSPEQLAGSAIDPQCDIWAVGIILHEMVTGRYPADPTNLHWLANMLDLDSAFPSVRETCPHVGPLGSIIDHCLQKRKSNRFSTTRELLDKLEPLVGKSPRSEIIKDEPFPGLSAFQESDAARFYGRTRDIAAIVGRLRQQQILVVAGPSGAGKSSLVRAGVIPALKRAEEPWDAVVFRPGRKPLTTLADVLEQWAGPLHNADLAPHSHDEILRSQPGLAGMHLRNHCRREGRGLHLLLFIDQFEELYTLGADATERATFLACLEGIADDAASPLRIIFAVRSEFLDHISDDARFAADVAQGLVLLAPIARDGLSEALTRPVHALGYRFEDEALVDVMLDELENTRCPLPLLQFTATKLWELRDDTRKSLMRRDYVALGGVAGALSMHADAVLATLSPSEQRIARLILLRLVTPERTRAIGQMDEFRGMVEDARMVEKVIFHLAAGRLLLLDAGVEQTTVELVHESLIERWSTLRQWLSESHEDAAFLSRLRASAKQWQAGGEAVGLVWRDQAARDAYLWFQHRRVDQDSDRYPDLGVLENRFLQAVVAHFVRSERVRKQKIAANVFIFIAVTCVVLFFALRAQHAAEEAREKAQRATENASRADVEAMRARNRADELTLAQAKASLERDPTQSIALLKTLSSAWTEWGAVRTIAADAQAQGIAKIFRQHSAQVQGLAFSPDGRFLASVANDRKVVFRDLRTGESRDLFEGSNEMWRVAFSPQGNLLAAGGRDARIYVWDFTTNQRRVFEGHTGVITYLAFSPDGKRIASRGFQERVRLWDVGTGTGRILSKTDESRKVMRGCVVFTRDGMTVTFADEDGIVLENLVDGTRRVFHKFAPEGIEIALSPDGKYMATGDEKGAVQLWHLETGASETIYHHTRGRVMHVAFSSHGDDIVSTAFDEGFKTWNIKRRELRTLQGHSGVVLDMVAAEDGSQVVTVGGDGTLRRWNTSTWSAHVFRGLGEGANCAGISPNGEFVAGGGAGGTVRLWHVDARERRTGIGSLLRVATSTLGTHTAALGDDGLLRVTATSTLDTVVLPGPTTKPPTLPPGLMLSPPLVFSGNAQRVALAHDDGSVHVHALADRAHWMLRSEARQTFAIALSMDGRTLVSGGNDGVVRRWDVDRMEGSALTTYNSDVTAVAIGAEGNLIASGSLAGVLRISDLKTKSLHEYLGHRGPILSVHFSPDGKTLISSSNDRTIRSWDLKTGASLVRDVTAVGVRRMEFFPDSQRFATIGVVPTVQIWDVETTQHRTLRGHTGPIAELAIAPDGKRLLTGSVDGTVKLWDVASGEQRTVGTCSTDGAGVAFAPNGLSAIAASFDGVVKVWTDDLPFDPAGVRTWLAHATPETVESLTMQ